MKCVLLACCIPLILSSNASCQNIHRKPLTVGDTIPTFTLSDQDGKHFNSSGHLGKSDLVIFFYPKDESMVCTKEACRFRDRYSDLLKAGAIVIGINRSKIPSLPLKRPHRPNPDQHRPQQQSPDL